MLFIVAFRAKKNEIVEHISQFPFFLDWDDMMDFFPFPNHAVCLALFAKPARGGKFLGTEPPPDLSLIKTVEFFVICFFLFRQNLTDEQISQKAEKFPNVLHYALARTPALFCTIGGVFKNSLFFIYLRLIIHGFFSHFLTTFRFMGAEVPHFCF